MAMVEKDRPVHIAGAGPAGLAAALEIAKSGRRAIVHERNADVGGRFHGDFQGLENWTTPADVLEELGRLGIDASFEHTPFHEFTVYATDGREYLYRSPDPLFYLVRRGAEPGTLDASLKSQALASGVEIRFREARQQLPEGGIVADGPRGADAIAVGYVFETDLADGAFAAISDRLAPKGYAYFLVHDGRATVATCLFRDFHNERAYLERTVDFFSQKAGLRMKNERGFGGAGNFLTLPVARKGNILFAGEAAGFQDALWGFGMRYAVISGHLAACALLEGNLDRYDELWRQRLGGPLCASIVNRYLTEKVGDGVYRMLLRHINRSGDVRAWLYRHYANSLTKLLLFPLASRALHSSRRAAACPREGCDCTWCRCRYAPSACRGVLEEVS